MKYKVDDEVRIKTWEKMKEEFIQSTSGNICIHLYLNFSTRMENFLVKIDTDRIVTIKEAVEDVDIRRHEVKHYKINEDNGLFCWTDEMIEEILNPEPIKTRWELLDL